MILEFEWVTLGWSKMVAFQQSGRETVTPSSPRKKTRYLLSLTKKGGRVMTHDQIGKQIKMWSSGVGERAFITLIMLEFSYQILNSMRNIAEH